MTTARGLRFGEHRRKNGALLIHHKAIAAGIPSSGLINVAMAAEPMSGVAGNPKAIGGPFVSDKMGQTILRITDRKIGQPRRVGTCLDGRP
jgi:hypothetical protein